MQDNNNFNPFEDDDENEENPYGFDFDPNALSEMFSDMFSGTGATGFTIPGLNQEPLDVAAKVAADIASKEIPDIEPDIDAESSVPKANDPMAEIMQIMRIMAMGQQSAKPLNVDSSFSARCEQIYPAAQNYLVSNTASTDVSNIPLVVTDRVSWTKDYIKSLKGPLGAASKSLNPTIGFDDADAAPEQGLDIQALLAKTIGPMLFGVQAGTMVGYLSHRAYGDDDVLLPTQLPNRVGIIASAVQKFADDWSIPADEAILYFLILQTLRAHLRSNSWLTKKLDDLCTRYVAAYELNPYKLEELMSDIDMSSSESQVMSINVTPEQMFEALRTPIHDELDEEIGRISSLHDVYVEWVLHKDIEPLLPNYRIIQEARKRITVTTSDADRFVEQLFGVAITPQFREKAQEFIDGVIERGEEQKLHEMWEKEEMIPTEAEFNAPGLWLARLEVIDI